MARNRCYIMLHINDQFDIMGEKNTSLLSLRHQNYRLNMRLQPEMLAQLITKGLCTLLCLCHTDFLDSSLVAWKPHKSETMKYHVTLYKMLI